MAHDGLLAWPLPPVQGDHVTVLGRHDCFPPTVLGVRLLAYDQVADIDVVPVGRQARRCP